MRARRVLVGGAVGLVCLILVACNPLVTNPESMGDLDVTSARYEGPNPAWIELSVVGAPDHQVYVFSSVLNENRTGPTDRSCIGDANAVVPCLVTIADVRMPNQLLLAGDGSSSRRLMTVWPEERVHVVVVCVDPVTQELACPSSMLTVLTAITEEGTRIGRLKP